MKLVSARITNFRCVEDSQEFALDQVTCLVGKNESGKTTLLQALYWLNPWVKEEVGFDRDRDYPRRHLQDYDARHGGDEAEIIRTKWSLEKEEIDAVTSVIGPAGNAIREVIVSKSYGKNVQTWSGIDIVESSVVEHLISLQPLHTEEADELRKNSSVAELKSHLEGMGERSERHQPLHELLQSAFARGTAVRAVIDVLHPRMPKFLYFSQYQRMSGQVALESLLQKERDKQLTDDDRVFIAFCDFVGIPPLEIAKLNEFERMIARFESASIKITRELFRYWSQNRHLKVQFRVDSAKPNDPPPFNSGTIIRTRIHNQHHDMSVPFDDRSSGFVWFFSFLVLFSQVKNTHGEGLIILLDEPALSLHAKAQADLLRYIDERLAPHHQVIYTTHSPFMVPADKLMSVRTVEDVIVKADDGQVEVLGTKVGDEVLSTDRDTLFPLQGALGYGITQTLFVGKYTLLVEGPSDILFLQAFSAELKKLKRTSLDPRWTICPVGGVRKISAFMSLFGAGDIHLAVLADYVQGDKKQIEELRRSSVLRAGHILTAEQYAGQAEADIEDIIGGITYVELVNNAYALGAPDKVKYPAASKPTRVVKFVESHFAMISTPGVPEFDHFTPSQYLFEHGGMFKKLPGVEAALDRFEPLFKDLNSFLPSIPR